MTGRIYRTYPPPFVQNNKINTPKAAPNLKTSFANELQSALVSETDQLIISKHAMQRLEQRGITINETRWEEIAEKVSEAKQMGVKESLVLLEEAALIVSAKNHTVITAMNRIEASQQIFTNINGTILMD